MKMKAQKLLPTSTMKPPSLLIAFLFTFFVSMAQPAAALTVRGRTIIGTIQKVNLLTHEVAMLRADKGTVITFTWSKRTSFIAGGRMTDAAILQQGAHVLVRHYKPFFGKPFMTRVTLLPVSTRQSK